MANKTNLGKEHMAQASAKNLAISTKHSIEICNALRYKTVGYAKRYLEEVIDLGRAVPFKRFNTDTGHKKGMAAGRYPQKAAKAFLALVKSVESNAQSKGLNSSNLKIVTLLSNKASVPVTGGRHRRGTKRTHLEIEVKEAITKTPTKKAAPKKGTTKKVNETSTKTVEPKSEVSKKQKSVEEKKEEVTEEESEDNAPKEAPKKEKEEDKGEKQ